MRSPRPFTLLLSAILLAGCGGTEPTDPATAGAPAGPTKPAELPKDLDASNAAEPSTNQDATID